MMARTLMARRRQARSTLARALLTVALVGSGCGVGSGTLRIDAAEQAIVDAAEAVVVALALDVPLPIEAAPREQCELRSGGAGLRSRVRVRAPVAAMDTAFDVAATALAVEGFVLVESGVPGTLLVQRDGMSVTIGREGALLALDGLTACRPR
jgi:hypothetical protein